MGAGKDLQRPMRMMLGTDRLAARAIVGPDIRMECVLNHSALNPKWAADDLTAACITGKVSDPERLLFYVGFDTPGWLTP